MKSVSVAIAGCGTIAMMKHLPALKNNNAKVVALFDKNTKAAASAMKAFGSQDTVIYDDYDSMLKDERIEAVYVLTPNYLHASMTIQALEANKHVFCEKPMATNYEDAKLMIEAKNNSGKLLTIGYQYRQNLDSIYLKKECQEDVFGDIYYAKARAVRRRRIPTWGSFFNKEVQGGGVLIDVGTHALDLTLYMMDNYEPAYCVGTTYNAFSDAKQQANEWGNWDDKTCDVEDAAFAFLVMKNGATVILESSWVLNVCDTCETQTLVAGTKGGGDTFDGLRINGIKHNTQYIIRPDVSKTRDKPFLPNFTEDDRECEVFLKAVCGEGELCVTAEQAATVTRILEAIYISAETKQPYYFK
ncbi:MAG: Gfo/Idh/MocA family oxidoreductase [Clostridiales bacterium]|nr:Gfo/Idh/MocA family oxidoreductase [Clostridiales bacterium]